jgi:hypothetical protein
MTTAADVAGELVVGLQMRGTTVARVDVASTRPQVADRLLARRTVSEALALVPRVFAICGRSQAIAAQLAVEAARDESPAAAMLAQRTRQIEAEMAHEYLWRALIDWSRDSGTAPRTAAFGAARAALAREDAPVAAAIASVVERDVLAGASSVWYDRADLSALESWIQRAATPAACLLGAVHREGTDQGAPRDGCAVPLLPPFAGSTASQVLKSLDADAQFERAPHLDGKPAETGALARLQSHPLVAATEEAHGRSVLTRLTARITELARLAAGRAAPKPVLGLRRLADGRGLGWVETARGLLLHVIDIAHGRIARYRIVAPTEWNFHARGALAAGLEGVHAADESALRRRADWLVQALDPCVTYRLEVTHA